ncbi:hypothetical protein F7725_017814 [Dissostichus mawsoni]|uniref:Uncharacterized protein n=1 Tax=Dissostichus mawsoni TaxID=36200 RepID=A0A7J5XRA4_DISMA|nr:hypothetical protein F7725_017814 [Dissostichus mawsoni]
MHVSGGGDGAADASAAGTPANSNISAASFSLKDFWVIQLRPWKLHFIFSNGPTTANVFFGQILKEGRAGVKVVHKECVALTEQRERQEVHHGGVAESTACVVRSVVNVDEAGENDNGQENIKVPHSQHFPNGVCIGVVDEPLDHGGAEEHSEEGEGRPRCDGV